MVTSRDFASLHYWNTIDLKQGSKLREAVCEAILTTLGGSTVVDIQQFASVIDLCMCITLSAGTRW